MAKGYATAPMQETDYRAESDYNSIQRACEILCDKIRMRGVLRHNAKQQAADDKMSSLLARYRVGKTKII